MVEDNTIVYNEDLSSILGELSDIMMRKGEPFKSRAYKKAEETIYGFKGNITSANDVKGLPGIGEAIQKKLSEYIETGEVKLLIKERNNPINILTNVHGIGPKRANALIEKGITTVELLSENKSMLNDVQQKGLRYYSDLLERIPREEIDTFELQFKDVFEQLKCNGCRFEIVGSYRRGAASSGDIDILITDAENNKNLLSSLIQKLRESNIIVDILSQGKSKCMAIMRTSNGVARRLDLLYTPPSEFPFAILYFTGSKAFNTSMRGHALKLGFSLNEHGLSIMNKKRRKKVILYHWMRPKNKIYLMLSDWNLKNRVTEKIIHQ